MIQVTDTIAIDGNDIEERFVRSIGARGQNARTEATAVELRLDLGTTSLPPDVRHRLIELAGRHVTTGGVLIVASRAARTLAENRDAAHRRLLALLRKAAAEPAIRTPSVPDAAAKEKRLTAKHRHGAVKRARHASDGG